MRQADDLERATATAGQALLRSLRGLEDALADFSEQLKRIRPGEDRAAATGSDAEGSLAAHGGRFARSGGALDDRVPPGAVLIATRLAEEGQSIEEIERFLDESFRDIDARSVIELVFSANRTQA